ncbi:putative serpin [Halocaridina rubra]|uniref:Serpin n=1 Tax=Halocaridina rubra TaxID=373956 RepID=A0AAN8WK07_HALRR
MAVMKFKVWTSALMVLCATLSHANRCFPDERPEFPSPTFATGVENFGLNIFKQMVLEKQGSSIFISPYSLWSVLSLAYFGSEGRTRAQLENALGLSSKSGTFTNWNALKFMLQDSPRSPSGAKFRSTNRAYFSDKLNLMRCLSSILFDLRRVDFTDGNTAKNIINHDVNITTEGKISNFIDFLPPNTQFALINAVYFKGLWSSPFNPSGTRQQEFLIPPGRSAGTVDMMVQQSMFNHGSSSALGATILELPYSNSSISMYLILPDTWDTDVVAQRLTRENFQEAVSQMTKKLVDVGLPKFKLTTKVEDELKSTLINLGIKDLFVPGVANLTAFTTSAAINADTAIHQATVEISEEGTVAAAASGVINTRFGGPVTSFFCNRPFLFLINDKATGITLFAGKLMHPRDTERL